MKPAVSNRRAVSRAPRVAVLVDTSTSWGRRVIIGIHNYNRNHDTWQLIVEARGMEERTRVPQRWRGEGIIARVSSAAMARELRSHRLPVINVSGIQLPGPPFPRVTTDMQISGEMALQHFLDRGFRHFAYFSLLGLSYVNIQQEAFVAAVRAAGCECALHGVEPHAGAEPDWNLNVTKLAAWLRALPKPVGILTWNADSGRQLIYACLHAGLYVPEEVSVLSGADDDLLCEVSFIPMSAILVAAEQIGYHAAELLDRCMRGKRAPARPMLIPPLGIVTRQSTDTLALHDLALLRAMRFIRDSAARSIQVSDVAQHAGLSRRVLERRFMQLLARSPAEEIRRVHLDRARSLLVDTEMSIPEVAAASGFGSPRYLAHVFKTGTGLTPLKYRRKIRSR